MNVRSWRLHVTSCLTAKLCRRIDRRKIILGLNVVRRPLRQGIRYITTSVRIRFLLLRGRRIGKVVFEKRCVDNTINAI